MEAVQYMQTSRQADDAPQALSLKEVERKQGKREGKMTLEKGDEDMLCTQALQA